MHKNFYQLLRVLLLALLLPALNFPCFSQECPLVDALKSRNKQLIEKLLADPSTGINCADSNNASALMWAIYNFNYADNDIAKILIKKGADPSHKGVIYTDSLKQSYVGSPLAVAAKNGNLTMVQFLIDSCGVDVDEREFHKGGKGWTALFYALQDINLYKVFDYLLIKHCNVNLTDENAYTPLVFATLKSLDYYAEKLIKAGANVNYTLVSNTETWSPLLIAAYYKRSLVMHTLIKNKADTTLKLNNGQTAFEISKTPSPSNGITIYHDCARDNCPELAEIIYKKGDRLNDTAIFAGGEKFTPLGLAFHNKSTRYAGWLISHGADTSNISEAFRHSYPLSDLFDEYSESLAELFETGGMKEIFLRTYTNKGRDAIIYRFLSKQQHSEMNVPKLFTALKKTDFRVDDDNTPLIYSIKNSNNALFDELIKKGAGKNYCNESGESPLMVAVAYNNSFAFNKLLQSGSDLNLANEKNQTALHTAILCHNLAFTDALIKKGAKLNLRDDNGNTPLLLALTTDQPGMVRLLINSGADKTLKNKYNENLFSLLNIPENSPDKVILTSSTTNLHRNKPVSVTVQVGFQDYNSKVRVSADAKMFVMIDHYLGIKLFDMATGNEILQLNLKNIHDCQITPDNKYLIIFQNITKQTVYVFNIESRTFDLQKYLGFFIPYACPLNNETLLVRTDSTAKLISIHDWKTILTVPGNVSRYTNGGMYCFTANDSILTKYKLQGNKALRENQWKLPCSINYSDQLYISPEKAFIFKGKQIIRLNFVDGKVTFTSQEGKLLTGPDNPYAWHIQPDKVIDLYHDSVINGGIKDWDFSGVEFSCIDASKILIVKNQAFVYDMITRERKVLMEKNNNDNVCNYTFSPDGTTCTYATTSGFVKNWSLIKSSFDTKLYGAGLACKRSCYDRSGKYIVYFGSSWGGSSDTYIYSVQKNAISDTIHESVVNVGFSTDNALLFLDGNTYSFPGLKLLSKSESYYSQVNNININSNWIAHSSDAAIIKESDSIKIVNLRSHNLISVFQGKFGYNFSCNFSHDDKSVVCSDNNSIFFFDVATGKQESSYSVPALLGSVDISMDGNYIAAGGDDNFVYILDRGTGEIVHKLKGHTDRINTVWFSHDGRYLMSGAQDVTVRLWDWVKGKELATLYALNSEDWAVITPEKLFDASDGAMQLINYSVGSDVLQLNQVKERFYEPGLLAKVMGYNTEPIRKVQGTGNIKIFPKVSASINSENAKLSVALTNQGGGIGKLKIFVNGKEIADDSRSPGAGKDDHEDSAVINLAGHPYLLPGKNTIEVKAMNAEGYLVSRGVSLIYTEEAKEEFRPNIYILTCGVSDYSGDKLDLKYASKDAEDMAYSFKIAAEKLFGKENTFVYSLNTSVKNDSLWPTKKNVIHIINKIAKNIKSSDLFVLYLSGHGINYGGQEGDFYYLTADAYSAADEVLKDNELRKQFTLSSQELTQLLQSIAAHKQVLLIDACASGRLVENLVAKRDISSSSIRALDRMKDRTGVHIITGCAADAVSYEATRYGQGVLTYSLLEGIKGSALRENKYIDVVQLFQKARERVPELAKGIGGIQIPQVISPYGAQSFDIGLLDPSDKALIPLAKEKPVIVRSNFQDADQLEDILQLSEKTDALMNDISMKGKDAKVLFMDIRDFPEAIKLTGLYSQSGGKILLKLKIRSASDEKMLQLESSGVDELLEKIYSAISQQIK